MSIVEMKHNGVAMMAMQVYQQKEGQLTLVGALGGDVAVVVHLDLRAVPGDIEESFDDHVGC